MYRHSQPFGNIGGPLFSKNHRIKKWDRLYIDPVADKTAAALLPDRKTENPAYHEKQKNPDWLLPDHKGSGGYPDEKSPVPATRP
jgi:hypothetical protein